MTLEKHELRVFTTVEVELKRGANAKEMLYCQQCKKHEAIFVGTMSVITNIDADGIHYSRITIERWRCLNCNNTWMEKYGVKSPDSGVEKLLASAIQLKYGGGTIESELKGSDSNGDIS